MSCPSLLPQYKTAEMPNIAAMDDFPEPEYLEGAAPKPHECTLAMLAHLGGLLLSFVPPAILMVTQQDKSHFVFRHAREAVNFQLSLYFHSLLVIVPSASIGFAVYQFNVRWQLCLLLASVVAFILSIPMVILELWIVIRACMAAAKGQEFRYPLTIRLI